MLLALFVVGAGIGFVSLIVSALTFAGRIDDLARAETPGRTTVTLSAGNQVVYAEYHYASCTGSHRDRNGASDGCAEVPRPDVEFTIRGPNEREVPVGPYRTTLTYHVGGSEGRAIGTIDVPADGQYTITATGEASTIAIGPSIGSRLLMIVGGIVVIGLCGIGFVITVIVMAVRRSRR
ncbi:MAG: hypothetical protein ACK5OX_08730 [Desertimonas sp.]